MTNIKTALKKGLDLLMQHPLLGHQPKALRERLLIQASLCTFDAGEMVFDQGQPALFWYLVLEGRIDTLRHGLDGEERVIQHMREGQLLAPVVMFMPQQEYPVSSRAVVPSVALKLPRENLRQACLECASLAVDILDIAGKALSSRIDDVDSLAGFSASQRLASYLLRLPRQDGEQIELPISQRQLAATLGVRAETLSRLLADWQKRGFLEGKRGRWTIADLPGLEQQAS